MAKYPKLTGEIEQALLQISTVAGRFEALGNILGELDKESVAEGLLTGDFRAEAVGDQVVILRSIPLLFDKNGRRIPPSGLVAAVCDPNRELRLVQPEINYVQRLSCLSQFGLKWDSFPTVAEFEAKSRQLIEQIKADKQLANLLKGVHLPICLPHLVVADYGQVLEEVFIPSVGRAYTLQFSKPFKNFRQGELQSQVTIVDGSRHERLLARMAEGPVAGLYFPNPLPGYSVHAQREQMSTLPESLLLSGGLDTATAWVMYPDVMARDFQTPGYDCSAVQWQSSECSLGFRASDDRACFGYRASLSYARDYYSGGLLFLG